MLENTKFCLKKEKKLSVVYLGGSITEGAGASEYSRCWVSLFDTWLKNTYRECSIHSLDRKSVV